MHPNNSKPNIVYFSCFQFQQLKKVHWFSFQQTIIVSVILPDKVLTVLNIYHAFHQDLTKLQENGGRPWESDRIEVADPI